MENVRQHRGEGFRRWFRDEQFDLIVWYKNSRGFEIPDIIGFQLCYDTNGDERAVTWYASGSYTHDRVDDGDRAGRRDLSPILVSDGVFPAERVAEDFRRASAGIDRRIAELVHDRLVNYTSARSGGGSSNSPG
jgi:hypothetical protein